MLHPALHLVLQWSLDCQVYPLSTISTILPAMYPSTHVAYLLWGQILGIQQGRTSEKKVCHHQTVTRKGGMTFWTEGAAGVRVPGQPAEHVEGPVTGHYKGKRPAGLS